MPALQQVGKHDGVAAVLAALAADGAVIVSDFLEPATLQHFRDDMEAHASGHRVGTSADSQMVQRFWGANTKRFTRLAHRSASFVEILTDPLYLAVADAVLLPNASDYWMNTGQMMIIGPGERAQWLHRDAENWPTMCKPAPAGFEVTLSCLFAISDFTGEVGATRVVPGSHLWQDYQRKADPSEVCQAVMPAAAVDHSGRCCTAGRQLTADPCAGLYLSYARLADPRGGITARPSGPMWRFLRCPATAGWRCSR
jgi:ectoine hydroxylase-related dioxygenase (phytanoyl-CoA dioxygenase family)